MAELTPYDPFPFLTQVAVLFTTLSPIIEQWVKERTDARAQHIMITRIKHLKHYCKRNNLVDKPDGIAIAVKLLFKDLDDNHQFELTQLLDDELDK